VAASARFARDPAEFNPYPVQLALADARTEESR
jgi:hypothetical protein